MNKEAKFGVWKYITDEENKPRWKCDQCGKICHKPPHDKVYCSRCGAKMKMEA